MTSWLERVRALCLALPGVTERPSHGAPAFFLGAKKCFVMVADDHHGDGRRSLWCAAAPGDQQLLVEASPDLFFVPPYVGSSGWVGFRLDRGASWETVAAVIADAHRARGAKKGR